MVSGGAFGRARLLPSRRGGVVVQGGVTELVLGGPRWAWVGHLREPSGVGWVVILLRKDAEGRGKNSGGGWGEFEPRKATENTEKSRTAGGILNHEIHERHERVGCLCVFG